MDHNETGTVPGTPRLITVSTVMALHCCANTMLFQPCHSNRPSPTCLWSPPPRPHSQMPSRATSSGWMIDDADQERSQRVKYRFQRALRRWQDLMHDVQILRHIFVISCLYFLLYRQNKMFKLYWFYFSSYDAVKKTVLSWCKKKRLSIFCFNVMEYFKFQPTQYILYCKYICWCLWAYGILQCFFLDIRNEPIFNLSA